MKAIAALSLLLAAAGLTACTSDPDAANPGNPNHMAYAGEPGSVYDAAANPPRNIGQVAYNPNQPLDTNLPFNQRLPTATSEPLQPLVPPPGSPALGTRTR